MRARRLAADVVIHVILLAFVATVVVPFAWAITTSLKTYSETFTRPYDLFPRSFNWDNYAKAFQAIPLALYFGNTLKIALIVCVGTLVTSSMSAYAFARLQFPGRNILFVAYLATLMVPRQVVLIPNFVIMRSLGLLDNHLSLVLTGIFTAYGTFLLRQFFLSIPRELEEAAVIDGYGYARRYLNIILPLAQPALATLLIITLLQIWNEYLYALVFINTDTKRTITLGLSILRGDFDVRWNLTMAAMLLAILPLAAAYLAAQRFFVEGIALSGVKG
jgi:multiple sugar transport system permease protein